MEDLTVGQRIVVFLSRYQRFQEDFECPPEMTQGGMADRLGLKKAHVGNEVRKLKKKGLVKSRVTHVKRAKTRRRVYCLTMAGERQAKLLGGAKALETARVPEDGVRPAPAERGVPTETDVVPALPEPERLVTDLPGRDILP